MLDNFSKLPVEEAGQAGESLLRIDGTTDALVEASRKLLQHPAKALIIADVVGPKFGMGEGDLVSVCRPCESVRQLCRLDVQTVDFRASRIYEDVCGPTGHTGTMGGDHREALA